MSVMQVVCGLERPKQQCDTITCSRRYRNITERSINHEIHHMIVTWTQRVLNLVSKLVKMGGNADA